MPERLLQGVYVPLITPFAADGSVALDAIDRLCHEYLDAGCAGIVALGTTGEATSLDADEQQAVIDRCAARLRRAGRAADRRRREQQHRARRSPRSRRSRGTPALAAALIVVPYYVRPSEAGIVEHFKAVAAASPVPLVIYNIPRPHRPQPRRRGHARARRHSRTSPG